MQPERRSQLVLVVPGVHLIGGSLHSAGDNTRRGKLAVQPVALPAPSAPLQEDPHAGGQVVARVQAPAAVTVSQQQVVRHCHSGVFGLCDLCRCVRAQGVWQRHSSKQPTERQ